MNERGRHNSCIASSFRFLAVVILLWLSGSFATAQVVVKGDVFGGGDLGKVTENAVVTVSGGTTEGTVYGGGKGAYDNVKAGLVEGNTTVTMTGGLVERSIYGGGELGSVGTFTDFVMVVYTKGNEDPTDNDTVYVPKTCASGTGLAQVTVSGGSVGQRGSLMPWNSHNPDDDDRGWVFCGGAGNVDSVSFPKVIAMAVVNATHLEISGSAFVTASVYGGCENGLVLDSTFVEIKGGQIGSGLIKKEKVNDIWEGTFADAYDEVDWNNAIQAVKDGSIGTALAEDGDLHNKFYACDAWDYGDNHTPQQYNVYDRFYGELGYAPPHTALEGTNGQTFFGNVFGGGSGFYPVKPGVWRRSAGRVNGNTRVEITGGHILTSVYGGNEITDIMGKATVKMSGGTIGVPRLESVINAHPVLCNLFGAGKGDQRTWANKWTNVAETIVEFTGGTIFGSIFGGGEDGHVLGNTNVTVDGDVLIGTLGYSGFEGHVYGSGRGFSGDALTAGGVCGNTNVIIKSGTILGSVYGGGRNGSVGPKLCNDDELGYGLVQLGDHGNCHVAIKGGTIGNDYDVDDNKGGHVFGGSMGSLTILDGSPNVLWPRMSRVRSTEIYISQEDISEPTIIKGSVYGGCGLGTVQDDTKVTIAGGTINGNVYGSGLGSDNTTMKNNNVVGVYDENGNLIGSSTVPAIPLQRAGLVEGNTEIIMQGGHVKGNVYGGGELASVGKITPVVVDNDTIDYSPVVNTGLAKVTITGGQVGKRIPDAATPKPTAGYVYGGGKGIGDDVNNKYKGGVNVNSTFVTIDLPYGPSADTVNNRIWCCVFGGGADGHVLDTAGVLFKNGVIGTYGKYKFEGNIFGGGRNDQGKNYTAGRVGGNVHVTVKEGLVKSNVYGGGNSGSIGADLNGNAYTTNPDLHGTTTVDIKGGTVGVIKYGYKHGHTSGDLDTIINLGDGGNVYGGGRGNKDKADLARVMRNTYVNISGGHVMNNVYGGGENGSVGRREAIMDSDDIIDYKPVENTGLATVTVTGGQVGPAPKVETGYNIPCGLSGENGYVFGGGMGVSNDNIYNPSLHPYSGKYYAVADVNYTCVTVNMPMDDDTHVNRIWGSIFGGAEDGHVLGSDTVHFVNGLLGTYGTSSYDGNIFGGGRDYSKANYNAGRVRSNITVEMKGGQILGSIFGGGRLALTGVDLFGNIIADETGENGAKYGNTHVMVKGGKIGNDNADPDNSGMTYMETFTEYSMGDVFGGGKGSMEGVVGHPKASALLVALVKNTKVEISEVDEAQPTRILGSVFGGGEVGNVGQFTWNLDVTDPLYNPDDPDHPTETTIGNIALVSGTGKSEVTVSGGRIGIDRMKMDLTLVGGTGADKYDLKYNYDLGHVFGGGEGIGDNPDNYPIINPSSSTAGIHNNKSLLDLMAVVGETKVTISDSAFVKGSVYGGSMSGRVLGNAKVTVSGGQIGAGYDQANNVDKPKYKDKQFINPISYFGTNHTSAIDIHPDSALLTCYRWDYNANDQKPFDPIALKADPVANKPTNGETWFGHVFGGGSGYYPYIVRNHNNSADSCVWNPDAGKVFGHTEVEITGGHILSNVYGGNQTTDVGNYFVADATYHEGHSEIPEGQLYNHSDIAESGKAIVTISGGTVGVPETISSIRAFPFTSNVYGGGQGRFRNEHKALGNVDSTHVTISGDAIVYGMVFGGSQNGHVLESTKVLVKGGTIGITGLSGYDGCVFGGGQGTVCPNPGHPGDSLYAHAGRVGGNSRVVMMGGKVLGNLYGGGMVALTGVGVDGWFDAYTNGSTYQSDKHGSAKVELSGGSVGNNFNHGRSLLKSSFASGNVYGGSRGKLDEYEQDDLGRLANSAVKIYGSPTVYGSVYGGGEMANVGYWLGYAGWYATNTASTHVNITGSPTIGTALEFKDIDGIASYAHDPDERTYYDTIRFVKYGETTNDTTYLRMLTHTRTGNVFGGGQGEVVIQGPSHSVAGLEQGHCATTNVNIGGTPTIRGSVFGGSEQGAVWGETEVHIAGGTIGTTGITPDSLKYNHSTHNWTSLTVNKATYSYGSVFGGSYGKDYYSSFKSMNIASPRPAMIDSINNLAGRVYGNTLVDITGGAICGNVFGGGNIASLGYWEKVSNDLVPAAYPGITGTYAGRKLGNATVRVSGNTTVIGPLDGTGLNAYVFGGGKGFSNDPDELRKEYANVDSTFVTVSGGKIWGSIFGGGSDSHVLGSTSVTVKSGANIGTNGLTTWDGNIFGGGRNFQNTNHTNGRVAGNTFITMEGGTIQGSIFGGGRMALTGVNMLGNPYVTEHVYDSVAGGKTVHGLATITVSGSSVIGNSDGDELLNGSKESVGDIFGSGKGDTKAYDDILAGRVANTKINVSGSPCIYGSVFGGGEMAGIGYWYEDGGKAKFYDQSGTSEVTISGNPVIGTEYEFGSEYYNTQHKWTVYDTDGTIIHTCTGNVFGGSQGDVDPGSPHWVSMARSRKAKVVVNGGTIKSSVYGGAEQGTVATDTYVQINGGIIGSTVTAADNSTYLFGGVYGGGYGSHRADYNTDTQPNDSTNALGNPMSRPNYLAGRVYGNTRVDVMGGTIQGDVFGGASFAYVGGYGDNPNGNVQVNIGSVEQAEAGVLTVGTTINGSVFGANNHSGTPFGNVNVDVYHTAHTEDNKAPDTPEGGWNDVNLLENTQIQKYAIKEVFGGGNHASYIPNQAPGTVPRIATVHVHYCENTIEDLYGGSNAADIGSNSVSANDSVIVDGGRFYRVFGGGNGTQAFANVHGTATTRINAGVINEVFGGGNHNGIIDEIDLKITHDNLYCDDFIYDVFGGNNEAEVIGDIVSVINCGDGYQYEFYGGNNTATIYGNVTTNVFGGETAYLFGGSKGSSTTAAHIRQFPSYEEIRADLAAHPSGADTLNRKYSYNLRKHMRYDPSDESTFRTDLVHTKGNVTLNIFGGTISQAAFGGSDENGTIDGKITVNVFDAQTSCNLDLNNLYGAGRNTDYKPIYDLPEGSTERISPVVNVIHGTVNGNAFGGGQGNLATVEASPVVNIGYASVLADTVSMLRDTIRHHYNTWELPSVYADTVKGNVYGGGELAQVEGNTNVNMYAGVVGDSVGHIENHLGADSMFYGLYAYELKGGRVFGGGEGSETNKNHGLVTGNATVTMSGGKVYKNVYGGGELSSVGTFTYDAQATDSVVAVASGTGLATVTIKGGEIGPLDGTGQNAYVFGGSRGKVNTEGPNTYVNFANVGSSVVTVCDSARIYGSIFGGAEDGHVLGDVHVYVQGSSKDTIPVIGTNAKTSWDGNLFGGGRNYRFVNNTAGRVAGNIQVDMSDGKLLGNLYGGGRLGLTGMNASGDSLVGTNHGYITVNVSGGTIGRDIDTVTIGNVFGGGKGIYERPGDPMAVVWDAPTLGSVKQTNVTISENARIHGSVYGGGELGKTLKNANVTVSGGVIGSEVPIGGGSPGTRYNGSVFGGGRGYDGMWASWGYVYPGETLGDTYVTMTGGQVKENVYGGGELAGVGTFEYLYGYLLNDYIAHGHTHVIIKGGEIGPLDGTGKNGIVYGGGQGLGDDSSGDYNTLNNVGSTSVIVSDSAVVHASVYGGAAFGHVWNNTSVLVEKGLNSKNKTPLIGTSGTTGYDGNIFGGGQGDGSNFSNGRVGGNTTVEMTDGTVYGNIYGGGRLALTGVDIDGKMQDDASHGNTKVMVKGGTVGNASQIETFTYFSMGNIYGGGKGISMDPAPTSAEKALLYGLTKNTTIEISDTLNNHTHVYGIVLGGGEIANVGNYNLTKDGSGNITNIAVTDGLAKVKISGGIIGGNRSQMRYELEDPSDPDNFYLLYNDDLGYVYGGGEGWSADPGDYVQVGDTSLVDLIATVQRTEVTITNDTTVSNTVSRPWIKASVFGGAESGHVKGDTKVTIAGGQIGAGYTRDDDNNIVDVLYTDGTGETTNYYINPLTDNIPDNMSGTYHWNYGHEYGGAMHYNPFDPVDIRNGLVYDSSNDTYTYTIYPSDGKSWFGNVFGGGSGWFPYQKKNAYDEYQSYWNSNSGKVWGNTEVVITGGHILNNVYGANESTDVGGKATIKMSGGTVGVPRTAAQVALQPVTSYIFGGGCGDPREVFDNETNVASTEVQITGGIVYGSVFGGAEDGHVLGNVDVKIGVGDEFTVGDAPNAITYTYPIIGSTGTSGADGNLFGGGRNFSHENNEAGRVEGNINIDMDGGVFLGSIYGGGRMGSAGVDVNGDNITNDPELHGNVTIDISGGTVGNRSYVLSHTTTSIGDVFGGGKGNSASADLGRVRNTHVKISDDAKVLNNLYGGGELANVGWATAPGSDFDNVKGGLTKIEISGGLVGIERIGEDQKYIKGGYVYGGGLGLAGGKAVLPFANVDTTHVEISNTAYITSSVFGGADNGHVWRNTSINMTGGTVGQRNTLDELTVVADEQPKVGHIYTGSVIGGGRGTTPEASSPQDFYNDTTGIVFGNATVNITGGVVRKSVYGGGGLSHVGTFTRDANGEFESFTKGKCTVSVSGTAHIGPTKEDLEDFDNIQLNTFFDNLGGNAGWVFGGGCGLADQPDLTFNDSTLVTIDGSAQVTGAVFGGGENGHVKTNTRVLIKGGTIGGIPLHGTGSVSGSGNFADINFTATTDEFHEDEYGAGPRVFRGNVYGGGKGNDFVEDYVEPNRYHPHAGQVYGNSKVEIIGGKIYNRVFGGGLLASVGTFNYAAAPLNSDSVVGVADNTGLAKVIVSGGEIGNNSNNKNNGEVYGGGRGLVGRHWEPNYTTGDQVVNLAYVGSTEVTVESEAKIYGNVYGGSSSGHVQKDAHVIVKGGTIGIQGKGGWHSNVYGGGGGQHQYVRNSSTNPPTMHHSITSGRVFGNTKVEISGGQIMHNVYGGGAIASVGTYNIYDLTNLFVSGTGDTEVTITGGTIGTDGNENGMVFGSGRGQIAPIGAFMDSLSYAVNTVVNIGTNGSATGPKVHGSVYGSGENGHVFQKATVNVYSGTIGCDSYNSGHAGFFANHGNVYGAGCGTDQYNEGGILKYNPRSGIVQGNTEVNIYGGHISHNVYGGGAMALVGTYGFTGDWGGEITATMASTGKTVVNVSGGTIGTSNAPEGVEHGNVYGASRGPVEGNGFTNLALTDTSYVFISGAANVLGSVFGGGAKSWTRTARVATISGGTVKGNVYGGGQNGIDDNTPFTSLKTVNVRGGHIKGNVFGSSYIANEKTAPNEWSEGNNYWSSFVNITGGTIDQNVYGAGYGGTVDGSVCVNIGLNAVNNAPTYTTQSGSIQANVFRNAGLGDTPLGRDKLKIGGDVFGGSYEYQTGGVGQPVWNHSFDITGYSTMFIDGDGYNTTDTDESVSCYMNLGGGIYGSGNYCESGNKGREIILRHYGTRNNNSDNELQTATRTLTTIQRGGLVLIDSTNINLSGLEDISGQYPFKKFGVLQVNQSLYVANGSGIVLGEPNSDAEVFMDSIRSLRSLYLKDDQISYNLLGSESLSHWQMVGINNSDDKLYRIDVNGSEPTLYGSALDKVKENVIIFNGASRLWVRYNDNGTKKYGELYGFFRMRQPFPVTSLENFAEARPKLTEKNNHIDPYTAGSTWNKGDGGFLSYVSAQNDFTTAGHTSWFDYPANNDDGGDPYTNTRQYPYLNIGSFSKEDHYQDMETYRVWAKPMTMAHKWYVDGRGIGSKGWGQDKSHETGWGDYPDKPKLTVSGAATGGSTGGICIDNTPNQSGYIFDPENDIIFVVGPIDASLEDANLNQNSAYPLKLYRYPGGHVMSNNKKDTSTLANPCPSAIMDTLSVNHNGLAGNSGLTGALVNAGPGPNYGTMVLANRTDNFVMDNVVVNGLYAYDAADSALYKIPESFATEKLKVSEPLVVTTSGSTTTLKGGTTLTNGYNNVDAGASTAWYTNPDYVATSGVHDGGALYVAPDIPASGDDPAVITTVNVEGLVTITGNKQKKGSGDPIYCNVYLPTFSKSLSISNSLDKNTHIGVTSPIRNRDASYENNTFSPVAVAVASVHAADTARSAWKHRNFHDDLNWFFVNGHRPDITDHERTTYYQPTPLIKATNGNTLYFGWTWANVVRKQPASGDLSGEVTDDFSYTNINSAYDLAWLISQSTGMNGQTATDFNDVPAITQTADIDLNKYVWVPIGKKEEVPADKAFAGHYDGRGHLITNLNIKYIGIGDKIYERNEYGLFGAVKSGSVNRTFVVDGEIRPAAKSESSKAALDESYLPEAPEADTLINNEDNLENRGTADAAGPYNIGGLVGYLQSGTVSNSEAAITVPFVSNDSLVVGGLVGLMANGTVHSSMAMPLVNEIYGDNVDNGLYWKGLVGGLVGSATGGSVLNSFASDQFGIGGTTTRIKIGGLVGQNAGANLSNCYVALRSMSGDHLTTSNFGSLAAINSSGTIDYCYSMKYLPSNLSTALPFTYTIAGNDHIGSNCSQYTPTMSSDVYGYMYEDNKIQLEAEKDTAMFIALNRWVDGNSGHGYARWARPALPDINGDLPVLMLDEFGSSGLNNHEGDFRSVATYHGGPALQYGGPVRDGEATAKASTSTPANELDAAIKRMQTDDALFVYGDIINAVTETPASKTKISIHEDASILHAGSLASYDSTYVGITFDNSCSQATSTPGINYGLNGLGMGPYPLPRDWHMFSSPLQAAPLGFNYEVKVGDESPVNTNNPIYELTYTNNPWNSSAGDFSWLQSGGSTNIRYWMKGWDNSQSQNGHLTDNTGNDWVDGYFPSRVANAGTNVTGFGFSEGCINESWASEYGLYPYGMDFYTWTEPDYHWINFKRNGPNHWKSDGEHEQIDYEPVNGATKKQNEDNLIVGRGYMASIGIETFMQSHGNLNAGDTSIYLTYTDESKLPGWNLVGNPYHGYIDFDKLADRNGGVFDSITVNTEKVPFYVVYNADSCKNEEANLAFRYYPKGGSAGGEYAERYLHPHQGFYIRMKQGIGSKKKLQFNESMLVPRDTITKYHWNGHFRSEQPAYPLVNLYLSSDKGCSDVTVIEFERPEWGGATKLKDLRVGNGLFYAHHDHVYYAACFAQEGTDRVPLWFEAKEDDIFTIKWNIANGDFHSMYLIDNITGIQYDMLRNDTYTFEGHKNDYWSRFLIVFNVTDVDENLDNDLFVFFDGSEWVVTGEGELEFVDVLGHVLMHTHVNDGQSRVRLPKVASGVYLMRLTNGEKCRVQKVIVNNK